MNSSPQFASPMLPTPDSETDLHTFFAGDDRECTVELMVDGLDRIVRLDSATRPFLVVGRSTECDLTLPDSEVSHRHASLQLFRGEVFCVDLMSRTGTYWGEERRRSGWLAPGEHLKIGPYRIRYPKTAEPSQENGLITSKPVDANLLETVDPFDVEFSFLNGQGHPGNRWRMNAPVVLVGKSKRCRLNFNHPSVSRVHCSLTATPAGVWITDLLGRSGTWVNEKRVNQHLLKANDVVRVGQFQFRVHYKKPIPRLDQSASPTGNPALPTPDWNNPPQSSGLSESAVMSMMDRFSQMQQQMFEMSHQQMMMMTQLVGNIHQNYNDLARQEFTRIQELGSQIDALRSELATDRALPAPEADVPPPQLLETQDDPLHADTPSHLQPPETESAAATPANKTGGLPSEQSTDDASAGSARNRFSEGDVESHALLIERMTTLENERNSRWKKLMGLLSGSPR